MRRWKVRFTPESAAAIRKLHPAVRQEVRKAIDRLLADPLGGKALHLELEGLRSTRVRTWRLLYRIDDEDAALSILHVGPRRSVYDELAKLLR